MASLDFSLNAHKHTEKALWIYSIIKPVAGLRRHTPERSAAIAEALSREYTRPDGKKVRVSQSQLYEWLKRYRSGSIEAIERRQRKDIGQRRVLISRKWDKACPLSKGKKQAIAETLAEYVRSLRASGASGWVVIQRSANLQLEKLSREAGWDATVAELKTAYAVSRCFIDHMTGQDASQGLGTLRQQQGRALREGRTCLSCGARTDEHGLLPCGH